MNDLIKRDPVLRKLAQLSGEKSEELTDRVILHSVESVKGLEFENVIFYRFGDLGQHFSELMSRANNLETDPVKNTCSTSQSFVHRNNSVKE